MKDLKLILNIYIFYYIFLTLISLSSSNILPKCCLGSENFGINIFSLGTSCSDKINCCPSGTHCDKKGNCIKNKSRKKKRKIKKIKDKQNNEVEAIRIEPEIVKKETKPKKFSGPVRINWKTFTRCLKESKSDDPIIKEILENYKKKKENDAMKIVFSELKKESPLIVECLNKQEHLT